MTRARDLANSADLSFDGSTFKIDTANDRVGIGTDSPSQKLHVSSADHTRVLITGGTDKYAELQFENDAQKFAMGVQNDDKFFLYNSTGTSQVLTIDTSDNIGFGTQSPSAPIDVVTNSNVYAAEFTQNNTSNGDGVFISVGSTASVDYALTVRSDAGNTSVLAAKADGKVGIGVFSPFADLTVGTSTAFDNGDNYVAAVFQPAINGGESAGMLFGHYPASGYAKMGIFWERYVGASGSGGRGKLHFVNRDATDTSVPTVADTRMTIDEAGNVGIGTTSPGSRRLKIEGSSSNYPLALDSTNTDYQLEFQKNGVSEWWIAASASSFKIHENGVGDKLTVLAGGNVGIGTNNPATILHVQSDSTNTDPESDLGVYHRFLNSNANINTGSAISLGSNSNPGASIYAQRIGSNNEHKMGFQTRNSSGAGGTRMTILGNGYVGIGTTTPQRMLHIADGAATGLHITNDQSGHGANQGFSQYIRDDNQDIEFVQRGNKRLVFYTNNTGVMAMKMDTASGTYPYVSIGHNLSKADKMLHLFGVNPAVMVEGNSTGYTEGCFIQKCDDSYRGGGMYMYNGNGGSTDDEWFAGRVYASSADWRVCFKSGPSGVGQDTAQATYNKFRIYQNGNYWHSGSNVSDERIKQDIVAETDQLANVLALKPKTFKFKPEEDVNGDAIEGAEPSSTRHGLIAQDVLGVLPHLVTGDASNEDERLGVDYAALTSVLVKAIQEQQELIQSLTARITTLESE